MTTPMPALRALPAIPSDDTLCPILGSAGVTTREVAALDAAFRGTMWEGAAVITGYAAGSPAGVGPRAQALADGDLADAQVGELAEVTRQHVGDLPVAITRGLFALIEKAVANRRHLNDWKGVWHDVLWMARARGHAIRARTGAYEGGERFGFVCIITGAGRVRNHRLTLHVTADDTGRPALTLSLGDED